MILRDFLVSQGPVGNWARAHMGLVPDPGAPIPPALPPPAASLPLNTEGVRVWLADRDGPSPVGEAPDTDDRERPVLLSAQAQGAPTGLTLGIFVQLQLLVDRQANLLESLRSANRVPSRRAVCAVRS